MSNSLQPHDLRGAINSAVDTTPVDQLLASLGYALGQIEAKALIAVTRLETLGAEASAAAGALREIRDIARNATTKAGPQDGHRYECCGKAGRISRHESWCTERAS